jgi:hypothetical protein
MEIIAIVIVIACAVIVAGVWLMTQAISAVWKSRIFWIVALATSMVLIPITAGLSVAAIIGILVLRFFLIGKVLNDSK